MIASPLPGEILRAEAIDRLAQRYGRLPTEVLDAVVENWSIASLADLGAYARQGKPKNGN